MNPNKTQLQQVRERLNKYGEITSWTAIVEFRVTRLSEYIRILRSEGLNITMTRIQNGKNWFGLYKLIK